MCHWGIAYAHGPNINTDVSKEMAIAGQAAVRKGLELLAVSYPSRNLQGPSAILGRQLSSVSEKTLRDTNIRRRFGNKERVSKSSNNNVNNADSSRQHSLRYLPGEKVGRRLLNTLRLEDANLALLKAQHERFSFSTIEEWEKNGQKYYDVKYVAAMEEVSCEVVVI
jgi:hypothetical protein